MVKSILRKPASSMGRGAGVRKDAKVRSDRHRDIATYISAEIHDSVQMLEQAAAMKISPDDEDLVEYITVLREGILEAYIGVVQGLVIRACLHDSCSI